MKRKEIRIIVFLFMAGLLAGSLFANAFCNEDAGRLGAFNLSYIEKMQGMNIPLGGLFEYVLKERLKEFILILILSFTALSVMLVPLMSIGFGFVMGITCSMMVMVHGINGTLYFLILCLLSHTIMFISEIFVVNGVRMRRIPLYFYIVSGLLAVGISAFLEALIHLNFVRYF